MQLKPYYTYEEIARLEHRSLATIYGWVTKDKKLPPEERRFPGAFEGLVPLADVKARYGWSNDDVKQIDLPDPVPPRISA